MVFMHEFKPWLKLKHMSQISSVNIHCTIFSVSQVSIEFNRNEMKRKSLLMGDMNHQCGSDSNQGTDYIANDFIIISSWISGFLWHKLKI